MEKRKFTELGLSPELLKAVDKMGFEEASPIQTAVIPPILEGRDVVGQSSTGSGKTAAFAIPAIERVDPKKRAVQILVLCPTRELAVQVAEEVNKLASFKRGVHEVPIYGGQSYERQFRALAAGVQIVIGTPGRVMDHMERGTLKLDALRMVILDEADRMLDMGFREDIEHILSAVPEERQMLFFSATMPRAIQEMIRRFARDPQTIRIEALAQNAPKVDQVYFEVDRRSKLEVLTRLIDLHDFNYGIVFCSTKIMVDELEEHLRARGYATDRLHGDISQAQRNRVMDKFRRRDFEFLVATDVAARGLDVDELEVVFNYDLPNDAEDYTHRIGRTGRAGKHGNSVTIVTPDDIKAMSAIGKLIDEEPKWIGEAPDAETMAEGMKRRGRGRRGASSDRGGRDARGKGDGRRERRSRDRGPRPQREAEIGSANGAEAEVADAPQHAHGGGEERSRPRREERPREGRREERRDGPRQGGRGEREAKPQAQQQKTRPQGRPHEEASPRKDEAAPRTGEARERKPVAFGLDENVPAFLRRPVRIAGR